MNAFELEITIQSKSGESNWPIVVRCKQPDGLTLHAKETLALTPENLSQLAAHQEKELEYGTLLGQAVFQGSVRETFVRALSKSSHDSRLRLLLAIEAADNDPIKTLHWERLCAPIDTDGSWRLLARDQRVPFSLYIPTVIDRYFPPIGRRDLRALVLIASPTNLGKYQLAPFDVKAVLAGVTESLGEIPFDVLANDIDNAVGPPTLQELSRQLTNANKPYTLLHFVCHGKLLNNGETVLYWATEDNQVLPVTGEELLGELKSIGNHQRGLPHFTFLCSCETADPRAEGALGGLAQRLVKNLGMPAVIAMTRKVSVETALALGRSFYKRLRQSGEIDVALQEATAGLAKRYDSTVPALFSRLGGRPLFCDRLEGRELTDEEIDYGIDQLRQLLKERAPHASVIHKKFETQAKKLKSLQRSDTRLAREDRTQALVELDTICDQVIDLGFEALAALGTEPPEYKVECPFPGLSSFADKKYHKFFFGREDLVNELSKALLKNNFLAVIGTSGSGKSSVVLAGLIPTLKAEEPSLQWAYMTPGKTPLKLLERRLDKLSKLPEHACILVIDQFEELFTLGAERAEQQQFIERVFQFTLQRRVVITMRADFLGECTLYPELRKQIETHQKLVGPMEPSELITAMKMQADSAGLSFEAGLSHAILDDVQGEPGVMPLLQYALQELWKRRRGRWLCAEEYAAIGGVQKAIAKTASDFYQSLPEFEQEQVQNIFLRLTRLDDSSQDGEQRRDTRRRVELEDLVPTGSNPDGIKQLIQQLAGEGVRLVVTSRNESTGKEEVEVAHEALIRHWPMLQTWLSQNHNDLQLRQSINQAAQEWQHHEQNTDRDSYLIHQGGRLEDAERLLTQPQSVRLNQEEAEYVLACLELRDRRRQQEERRRKLVLAAATTTAFILGGFALFAGYQWRQAEINKIKAALESADALLVSNQTLKARIKTLQAAKQLKYSLWQTILPHTQLKNQVIGKLSETFYAGREFNRIKSPQKAFYNIAFSPDGQYLATNGYEDFSTGQAIIYVWDHTGRKLSLIKLETSQEQGNSFSLMRFSPNSQLLVTAGDDDYVRLWDVRTGQQRLPNPIEFKNIINNIAFSPEGQFLAIVGENGAAQIWNIQGQLVANLQGHEESVYFAQFSLDGRFLVTAGADETARLWDSQGKFLQELPGHDDGVTSVMFSPNHQLLVTAGQNGIAQLWNLQGKLVTQLIGHQGPITGITFSPDSNFIFTGGQDNQVIQWNLQGEEVQVLEPGHQGDLHSVTFSAKNKFLVTSSQDDTIRLWESDGRLRIIVRDRQDQVESNWFTQDDQVMVTLGQNGVARLWNTDSKRSLMLTIPQVKPSEQEDSAPWEEALFNREGEQLSVVNSYGRVSRWNVLTGQESGDRIDTKGQIALAEFSFDGRWLMTGEETGKVSLWDLNSGRLINHSIQVQGQVAAAEFSLDGKLLLIADTNGNIDFWDTESGQSLDQKLNNKGRISEIELSPNSEIALIARKDSSAQLWNRILGEPVGEIINTKGEIVIARFSADGKLLFTAEEDGNASLWNANSGQKILEFAYHGVLNDAEFSPDGQFLVTGGEDNNVYLWDIVGNQLGVLQGHKGAVLTTQFSADGQFIFTFGAEHEARRWKIGDLDELMAMNCDWIRDYLQNPNADITKSDRNLCNNVPKPAQ